MLNVTQILSKIESGDRQAASELLPVVYDELRKLAAANMIQERPDHTLQATALVHEAYLRLVDIDQVQGWESRGHFFAAAAEAMRRVLIDRARDNMRLKRNQGEKCIDVDSIEVATDTPDEELLALNEMLSEFEQRFPDSAQLVKMRFFGGLSLAESAAALGIPRRTADRKWAFARSWLHKHLTVPDSVSH
ncbi:ECF sigma factor [Thalassoglobus neptunius]|uniref:ECF sigma factor n=1 Tax=Thalassoglobus neptunius TaxID=1938619 RepID=A0A5C5V8Q9_9PLAN|nr:sigma-70 family RNA polymerase sigma factor [Thalassoglobus neptunius]TWT34976.1 ECF sigma factor [Thalassoglobus neptunius]